MNKTKRLFCLAFLCLGGLAANAQWTNGTDISNTNSGKVGIGTPTPTASLEIANHPNQTFHAGVVGNRANTNIQMAGSAAVLAANSADNSFLGAVAYDFFNEGNNPSWSGALLMHYGKDMTGSQYGVATANQGLLLFQNCNSAVIATNGVNLFMSPGGNVSTSFLANGCVGINTYDTKGYRFAVNGDAIFNKVVVKPYPWADYVFDSTYQLSSLRKVEQYIKTNHHLPDMPSADSVAAAGIDVGANQAALLKKVEELTLYVIEQNKKIEDQARRLKRLEHQRKK